MGRGGWGDRTRANALSRHTRRHGSPALPLAPVPNSFEVTRDEADPQTVHFRVDCSKGTYVRTLAFDLGKRLGSVVGAVYKLRIQLNYSL